MYTISKIEKKQLNLVQDLAYQIWPIAYSQILSNEQLTYMLDKFYSIEAFNGTTRKWTMFF